MPDGDVPPADLGPQLDAALLHQLGWVVLGALVLAVVLRWPGRRRTPAAASAGTASGTPSPEPEPRGRLWLRLGFGLLWIVAGLLQARPMMAGSFVQDVVTPAQQSSPAWLADLSAPMLRAWTRHPVAADAATVWIQIGLGLLLVVGRRGVLARVASAATIAWALVVWALGEGAGGLFGAGAGWLTGAPGAALVYALAAVVLLLPESAWRTDAAQRLTRRLVAGWFALGAVLQAIPAEGFWGTRLADPFTMGSLTDQPGFLRAPITDLARVAREHAAVVDATVVVLLVLTATAVWVSGRTAAVTAGLVLCGATWWLAQDFGVLGATATDPNTALPLGVLLAAALPAWSPARAPLSLIATVRTRLGAVGAVAGTGIAAAAVGLAFVVPAVLVAGLGTAPDSAALAADSAGGLRAIPARPAAPFDLTDQHGQPVSSTSLRGKLVLITFLDPVCTSDCPLIANQLALADRALGELASGVELVAVDTNPVFDHRADVQSFTRSHGLASFANWHFLYGPAGRVQSLLDAYGIAVDIPAVGMIQHSEGVFFVDTAGRQVAYLDDGAGRQLTETYAQRLQDEIRTLLR